MTLRKRAAQLVNSRAGRAGLILLVLGAQVGFMVWYGSLGAAPAAGAYPGSYELSEDYDSLVGERVSFAGPVVDTDPVTVRIAGDRDLDLVVEGAPAGVQRGDRLRIFATVRPDHQLDAINAFTASTDSRRYMYAVSALAGLWALWRLERSWRVDPRGLSLVPRRADNGAEAARRTESEVTDDA